MAHRARQFAHDLPIGTRFAHGSITFRTRCTLRSAFMNVPFFSNEDAAGRNTVPDDLAFRSRTCPVQ